SRHPAVDRLIGTLALSRDGLPFDSLDGEPVYVFILLVSPQDRPGDHLRALEAVVRTMRNDQFVQQLRACQTREEIWALLENTARGGGGGARGAARWAARRGSPVRSVSGCERRGVSPPVPAGENHDGPGEWERAGAAGCDPARLPS